MISPPPITSRKIVHSYRPFETNRQLHADLNGPVPATLANESLDKHKMFRTGTLHLQLSHGVDLRVSLCDEVRGP